MKMVHEITSKLFLADGGPHGLSVAYASKSGGGKTYHFTRLVKSAASQADFKNTRFIYTSIKNESYFDGVTPTDSVDDVLLKLETDQIVVYYPPEADMYESDIDELIEGVFNLKEQNSGSKFVIAIDDCNCLDGFNNRGTLSKQVKKLIIAGRSKNVKGCFLCHRLTDLPRIARGNFSSMVVFNISPMDNEQATKTWGIQFDDYMEGLTDFRWLFVDMVEDKITRYSALPPPSDA